MVVRYRDCKGVVLCECDSASQEKPVAALVAEIKNPQQLDGRSIEVIADKGEPESELQAAVGELALGLLLAQEVNASIRPAEKGAGNGVVLTFSRMDG